MKTIQLKSISLVNFKGIKSKTIEFGKETNIFGANGTGKTTLFDAFCFLLFGKDSSDRTAFEIKTLDADNNPIPKIDHEVSAIIEVDGEVNELRRTFREKWVKKRGSLESEFGGNETLYFWNEVPLTLRDYSAKVSAIVDESVFKLITSPVAFNALKWQDQRQVLLDISGGVSDADVAAGNPAFEKLLAKLVGKTMEEYQKQINSSIRKSKDDIKMIPTRIDEVQRSKPEAVDFESLEKEISKKETELAEVEDQISDKVAAQQEILNKRTALQQEIYKLESDLKALEHEAKMKAQEELRNAGSAAGKLKAAIREKESERERALRTLAQLENYKANEEEIVASYTKRNNEIRQEWNARNAEEFKLNENECKCPTCNRAFEAEDIEAKSKELLENFQKFKMRDLEDLTSKGRRNAQKIEDAKKELVLLAERIAKGNGIIETLTNEVAALHNEITEQERKTDVPSEGELIADALQNTSYDQVNDKVKELKEELDNLKGVDIEDLKTRKTEISAAVSELRQRLLVKDQLEAADKRIAALQKEESELAQLIADYERDQYTIEQFTRAKIDRLESLINERFSFVKFKLFETQVNGGEVPTCKALINGVPFSDANTASKINAGIDIINTLCQHYSVSAPIFIDNRESVVELIDSRSQIINLIVSKADKTLRIEAQEMAEMF